MIIKINSRSEMPIYLQLRNQIVKGIGKGELEQGEILPTVRQMAADLGVNAMTVSKAYQLLKVEGFIETDRRKGSIVCIPEKEYPTQQAAFEEKLEDELELLTAETKIRGKKSKNGKGTAKAARSYGEIGGDRSKRDYPLFPFSCFALDEYGTSSCEAFGGWLSLSCIVRYRI